MSREYNEYSSKTESDIILAIFCKKSERTNTLCMKYEKKSSEGTDWVYLNKSGISIGVRNF